MRASKIARCLSGSLLIFLCSLSSLPVQSELLEIAFRLADRAEVPAVISVQLRASPAGLLSREQSDAVRELSAEAPGIVTLELAGHPVWQLAAEAPGFWAEPLVVVRQPGQERVTMTLHPVGAVVGRLQMLGQEKPPERLKLRFESSQPSDGAGGIPRSEVECSIVDGAFRCEAPAGRLDLRLRSPGYVSHFFWRVAVEAGEDIDLGALTLHPGASLVGVVVASEGELSPADCRLELKAASAAAARSPEEERRREGTALGGRIDERGFFRFEGIPPGTYRLEATHPGFAKTTLFPLEIAEVTETSLRDPLVLEKPLTLELQIDPPLDLTGEPWHLSLSRRGWVPSQLESVGRYPLAEDGTVKVPELEAGPYILWIESSSGERVVTRAHQLTRGDTFVHLELDQVPVEGTVFLGDEPLGPAEVCFGGRQSLRSVRLEVDEEGSFSGVLPEEGAWTVEVREERLGLRRSLRGVEVKAGESGSAYVELRFPNTRLAGTVVDGQGAPKEGALVILVTSEDVSPLITRTNDHGEFRFAGLEEGPTMVSAQWSDRSRGRDLICDPVQLQLSEDLDPPPLTLVVRDQRKLQGRVLSQAGPRAGARVMVLPRSLDGRLMSLAVPQGVTDADGGFTMSVPEGASELGLVVLAPGFGLQVATMRPPFPESLDLWVDASGGSLELELGEGGAERLGGVIVFRDGVPLEASILLLWAEVHGVFTRNEPTVVIPQLAPGEYLVCSMGRAEGMRSHLVAPAGREGCTAAYVLPGGTTSVELVPKGGSEPAE